MSPILNDSHSRSLSKLELLFCLPLPQIKANKKNDWKRRVESCHQAGSVYCSCQQGSGLPALSRRCPSLATSTWVNELFLWLVESTMTSDAESGSSSLQDERHCSTWLAHRELAKEGQYCPEGSASLLSLRKSSYHSLTSGTGE